jgi:hypothetical protein
MKKNELIIDLIPKTCWWSSVRAMVTPAQWDILRFATYKKADNKCEVCGGIGTKQGFKHKVECHEIFEYDTETKTQKLTRLISLCPMCHLTTHFGRAQIMGKESNCINHMFKVNKWTMEKIKIHIAEAFRTYKERSKYVWKLDISLLNKEPYNLNLELEKERIFEVKKYVKKKKIKKKIITKKPPKR